jgi:hypothetical protein
MTNPQNGKKISYYNPYFTRRPPTEDDGPADRLDAPHRSPDKGLPTNGTPHENVPIALY